MGKLHFRPHDRMMKEERGDPLSYKSFFIQTYSIFAQRRERGGGGGGGGGGAIV